MILLELGIDTSGSAIGQPWPFYLVTWCVCGVALVDPLFWELTEGKWQFGSRVFELDNSPGSLHGSPHGSLVHAQVRKPYLLVCLL
jgi:hypothetical protein